MTAKTLFNRKHGQSPGETNSKEDISKMTGIILKKEKKSSIYKWTLLMNPQKKVTK